MTIYLANKKSIPNEIKQNIQNDVNHSLTKINLPTLSPAIVSEVLLDNVEYVRNAKCFRGLKKELICEIKIRNPVATVYDFGKNIWMYLDKYGKIYTKPKSVFCRVPFLQVDCSLENLEKNSRAKILKFLSTIRKDKLLQAEISSVYFDGGKKILVHTVSEKKIVDFGALDRLNKKIEKLKIYYTHILPYRGFNYYKKINLAFDNQIVCE